VKGVLIGAQSYSFRDRWLDAAIDGLKSAGISGVELWQGHFEPREPGARPDREKLRAWRLSTPASYFKDVRAKLDRAGIELYAVNISFRDDWTDEEVAKGFDQAEALGIKTITASSNQRTVARVAPIASKRGMIIAVHNHSNIEPNEFATPDDFLKAMAVSPAVRVNLDIGHFTAANFDAVDFLRQHHDRIVTLHIKDRKRNQGPNVPFGEGDTPIKPVLQMLRDRQWAIPAGIEYEYRGADTVAEVKRCVEYCRQALLET
jgi:sugar phosphate isomerase/epimerase